MLKKFVAVTVCFILLLNVGCYTNKHVVGQGATGSTKTTAKQWYAFWGLLPISHPSTNAMAAGSANYEVKTQFTFVDGLISIFTGIVTIAPRTVEVTK